MAIYTFKTTEDIDTLSRTIVKEVPVEATTSKTEFTLESKESQLASLKEQKTNTETQITELEAEILEIKTALEIPLEEVK